MAQELSEVANLDEELVSTGAFIQVEVKQESSLLDEDVSSFVLN